jgi:hypothetical protein
MVISHYPEFYRPDIRTVVVLPMANSSQNPSAGQSVTGRLVEVLRANGTYEVVGPLELRRRMEAAGLTVPEQGDVSAVLPALRTLGGVQAVITGQVVGFDTDSFSHVDFYGYSQMGYYGGYGRHSHRGYWMGGIGESYPVYEVTWYTRSHVAVNVTLTDVASGAALYASPGPISADMESRRDPPPSRDEMLRRGVDYVVAEIMDRIAIVPAEVTLKPKRDLRLAAEGMRFTDKFSPRDTKLLVVLRLPAAAAHNEFRIGVSRKDGPELAGATFTWKPGEQERTFEFNLADLTRQGGPGKYVVTFFRGGRAIMTKGFEFRSGGPVEPNEAVAPAPPQAVPSPVSPPPTPSPATQPASMMSI